MKLKMIYRACAMAVFALFTVGACAQNSTQDGAASVPDAWLFVQES
jgi:hypothetical protein